MLKLVDRFRGHLSGTFPVSPNIQYTYSQTRFKLQLKNKYEH